MADRDLGPELAAATDDEVVRPIVLIDAEFASGMLHLCTSTDDFEWNGETYIGAGKIMAISPIEETGEIRATAVDITLQGLDPSIIALALADVQLGLPVTIHFGLLDEAGDLLDGEPYASFQGLLDMSETAAEPKTAKVTVKYENRLARLEIPKEWRWTDQDQRTTSPTDGGLRYAGQADKQIKWG